MAYNNINAVLYIYNYTMIVSVSIKFTINSAFSVLGKVATLNVCMGLSINGFKNDLQTSNLIIQSFCVLNKLILDESSKVLFVML